jgi:hypothetical protein
LNLIKPQLISKNIFTGTTYLFAQEPLKIPISLLVLIVFNVILILIGKMAACGCFFIIVIDFLSAQNIIYHEKKAFLGYCDITISFLHLAVYLFTILRNPGIVVSEKKYLDLEE